MITFLFNKIYYLAYKVYPYCVYYMHIMIIMEYCMLHKLSLNNGDNIPYIINKINGV